jgi:hypothetical protein
VVKATLDICRLENFAPTERQPLFPPPTPRARMYASTQGDHGPPNLFPHPTQEPPQRANGIQPSPKAPSRFDATGFGAEVAEDQRRGAGAANRPAKGSRQI